MHTEDTGIAIPTEVDPKKVDEFLKSKKKTVRKPRKKKTDPTPSSKTAPATETKDASRINIPIAPVYVKKDISDEFTKFHQTLEDLGEVEVTMAERKSFLKALLEDDPWILPVQINPSLKFIIRSLTEAEFDAARKAAVELFEELGEMTAPAAHTCLKRAVSAIHLVGINDKLYPGLSENEIPTPEAVKKLVKEKIVPMSMSLWSAASRAVAIFEVKRLTCLENIANATFWDPAS